MNREIEHFVSRIGYGALNKATELAILKAKQGNVVGWLRPGSTVPNELTRLLSVLDGKCPVKHAGKTKSPNVGNILKVGAGKIVVATPEPDGVSIWLSSLGDAKATLVFLVGEDTKCVLPGLSLVVERGMGPSATWPEEDDGFPVAGRLTQCHRFPIDGTSPAVGEIATRNLRKG